MSNEKLSAEEKKATGLAMPVEKRVARRNRAIELQGEGKSLRAIGQVLGEEFGQALSAERVRQILSRPEPGAPGNPAFQNQGKNLDPSS